MTTPELPEPAVRITVELAMVKGGVTKPAPFYSADQMHDLASRLASLQTDCDGLVRQNEALHRVCRQKEESIAAAERELAKCGKDNCMGFDASTPGWKVARWVREERLQAAERERDALAEDAQRYRYLQRHRFFRNPEHPNTYGFYSSPVLRGGTIDEAIDAALSSHPESGEGQSHDPR